MPVQRKVKVTTTQEILKDEPKVQEFPMRKWSIEISLVGPNGEDLPATLFDKVTYILHPTFKDPTRAFKTPPFRLEEKGWGEFDLNINLHVAERGGEHKLTHDLNFQKTRYEVIHTLNFPTNKPALLRLLAESGPVPEKKGAVAGAMDSIDGAQQMHAVGSATAGVADLSLAAGGAPGTPLGGGNPHKRKQDDGTLAAAAAAAAAGNGSATAKFKKKAKIEKGSVDLERLADGLRQLGEDDLLGVVEMVTDNLTKEMYIKNDVTEGEFHMDLYTLPDPLLRSLWEYVKKRVAV